MVLVLLGISLSYSPQQSFKVPKSPYQSLVVCSSLQLSFIVIHLAKYINCAFFTRTITLALFASAVLISGKCLEINVEVRLKFTSEKSKCVRISSWYKKTSKKTLSVASKMMKPIDENGTKERLCWDIIKSTQDDFSRISKILCEKKQKRLVRKGTYVGQIF